MVAECVVEIPLDAIQNNPWQTRPIDPAHVEKLAQSIKNDGLIQRPSGRIIEANGDVVEEPAASDGDGFLHGRRIQLAVGHHRVAAYRLLAEKEPKRYGTIAIDVAAFDDEQMADLAMLENDERKDLNDIERARALQERKESFGWSNAELGRRYGMARSTVSNLLRLLDLPDQAQQAVCDHDISVHTALALASAYGLSEVLREAVAPDTLLDAAIDGTGGDKIREILRRRVREHTVSLGDEFPPDHSFETLAEAGEVVSAHCLPPGSHRRACPLLVELGRGGTDKRCPRRSCRDTKVDAWRRQQSVGQDDAESASDVDPDDHGHIDNRLGMDRHEVLDTADGGVEEDVSVSPDVNEPDVNEQEHPARHDASLDVDVEQKIVKPAVQALERELSALNPKTLVVLYYKMQYGRPSEGIDWSREEALRAIAKKLVDYELPYNPQSQPSAALKAVSRLLRKAGAELPWESQEQEV